MRNLIDILAVEAAAMLWLDMDVEWIPCRVKDIIIS